VKLKELKQAKFDIGQIVKHTESGYRGVIVDIDPEFTADASDSGEGVPPVYRANPWYHVLLDEDDLQAYIAEQELQRDSLAEPIHHEHVDVFFSRFDKDHYISRYLVN
jgi:heat shock protein HspQ